MGSDRMPPRVRVRVSGSETDSSVRVAFLWLLRGRHFGHTRRRPSHAGGRADVNVIYWRCCERSAAVWRWR